jgi:catechol 2,3-dioxygenase-like lactoylglutathione lyase family enzyme
VIDHTTAAVSDVESAKGFYEQALKPLGYEVLMEFDNACGIGTGRKPDFWIAQRGEPSAPVHVAIASADRPTVDAFYAAAVDAGGTDNGPPGVRSHYHEHYYGAFVHDPDGNNIEAVCHSPA